MVAHGNLHHTPCGLYRITLIDVPGTAQQNYAHIIFFQIQHHAVHFAGEFQQFTLHGVFQSMYTRNTICDLNNCTHIGDIQRGRVSLNLILDN